MQIESNDMTSHQKWILPHFDQNIVHSIMTNYTISSPNHAQFHLEINCSKRVDVKRMMLQGSTPWALK